MFSYISKIDSTDSVTFTDEFGRKISVISPSKKMLPSLIAKIKERTLRPDKLIGNRLDIAIS